MASASSANGIGDAIVAFTLDGRFPESEDISSLPITSESLPPALAALGKTRMDLEVCTTGIPVVSTLSKESPGWLLTRDGYRKKYTK